MKKIVLLGLVLALFSGCVGLEPMTPQQIISQSQNPKLTENMLSLDKKKYITKFYSDEIMVKQNLSQEKGFLDNSINQARSYYINKYDSSSDEIANIFVKTAKDKGHTVKMYKSMLNRQIEQFRNFSGVKMDYPFSNDLDNILIEYDSQNKISSVLLRFHVHAKYMGYIHERYSVIIFDPAFNRRIESQLNNRYFEETFIRNL
jgi:uncharacterized protein YceK